jgi:riboflavin biosynthesis pyrimidine reductase
MASTVDGRIIAENWGDDLDKFGSVYEDCHGTFESQAWLVGRVTMEKDFSERKKPGLVKSSKHIDRKAFVADKNATSYEIAVDPKGKLGWEANNIQGDHVIEILSESVSDEYLHYLTSKKISYILAGKNGIDFKTAFQRLAEDFKIRTIMLEGGGHVNGSVLSQGLVDELSLLILPLADGTKSSATIFEIDNVVRKAATKLKLKDVQKLESDIIWLKYDVQDK